MSGDELLTVEEAAQRMKISARHVRRLVAERRIAYVPVGRCVRLAPADIAAYIAAVRVEAMTTADVLRNLRGVA
ncbi:MAG TPA: helix-turn-helix domain-containing protein [Jatrophihabitantaceae bacterium]|nr:helix-turn-helix domain-containing protein [Jatrophihabitantaceae bacterium]